MTDQITEIPLDEIFSDNDFNCRGDAIAPFDVIDLAKSIDESGLLQPIVVQPFDKCPKPSQKYRIVMGHRRYLAHRVNKAKTIKAIIKTGLSDEEAFTANFIENITRKDLNILQEARALSRYRLFGMSMEQVGQKIKKSYGWVQVRYQLLDLPLDIQNEAAAGLLSQENIKQLYTMPREKQYEAVRMIKDAKLKGSKPIKIKETKSRPVSPFVRKIRNAQQIREMLDLVYDGVGANLATRALAWASGNISDIEFLKDIKKYADDNKKLWSIPNYIRNAVGSF